MILKLIGIAVLGGGPGNLGASAPAQGEHRDYYEALCFRAGSFSAFAEMVRMEVKTLALSPPMTPEEMDRFMPVASRIAEEERVAIYREPELLVTDLFPAEITAGKHVVLIYKGTTLQEYLSLKTEKSALERQGIYAGKRRKDIARKFGKLLSYPDAAIEEKLANPGTPD